MTRLLESLASDFTGDATRQALLAAALRDGLPDKRVDRWKYTSLHALGQRAFAAQTQSATIDRAMFAHIPAPRIVFINGRHDQAMSDLRGLAEHVTLRSRASELSVEAITSDATIAPTRARAEAVFDRLNAAFASDGVYLHAGAQAHASTPIHLVFVGAATTTDIAWHARHRIELEAGAVMTLIEHHLASGAHAHLGNTALQVHLADGAQLQHLRIQQEGDGASLIARTDATLGHDARYCRLDLELGAALSRHELNVRLEGERARLEAHGVLLATGTRHLDTRIGIEHFARDTACEMIWRGMAGDRGRAVFHGGIVIQPGADGSDARLSNKNLLLSAGAEIDTQPVLEIHADEVKAAHGATVGQLDERALYYLRSRGIGLAQARRMLTAAFGRQVLAALPDDSLLTVASSALDAALVQIEGDA